MLPLELLEIPYKDKGIIFKKKRKKTLKYLLESEFSELQAGFPNEVWAVAKGRASSFSTQFLHAS